MATEKLLGIVSPIPRGGWSEIVEYQKLNIVRYGTSSYIAKKENKGELPPSSDNWILLNVDGSRGEKGDKGDNGDDYVLEEKDILEIVEVVMQRLSESGTGSGLPSVDALDEGKILQVVNGKWELVDCVYNGEVFIEE